MSERQRKSWLLDDYQGSEDAMPQIHLLGQPGELMMGVGSKSFIGIKEDSITLAGGSSCKINVQGLPDSFIYGGMVQDMKWPLTMIPSTTFTPLPRQIIKPPMVEQLPTIVATASIATSMLA